MHELTLCYQAFELVEQHAKQQLAKRVTDIWIDVGALSCVEVEAMQFCFELVCKDTIAEGCHIHINQQKATGWCDSCNKNVVIDNAFIAICSTCGNPHIKTDADDQVLVKRIQIE